MENKIRFAAAVILTLLAGYLAVLNWWGVVSNVRNRRRGIDKHYSPAPFLSAVFAVCAYLASPGTQGEWILIIPAMDIGNWLVLIGLLVAVMRGRCRGAFKKGLPKQPEVMKK